MGVYSWCISGINKILRTPIVSKVSLSLKFSGHFIRFAYTAFPVKYTDFRLDWYTKFRLPI